MDLPIGKVKCGKISVWKSDYRIVVKRNLARARRKISNNRFDLATLCHDSCDVAICNRRKNANQDGARIAPLNALQVKRMLCGRR